MSDAKYITEENVIFNHGVLSVGNEPIDVDVRDLLGHAATAGYIIWMSGDLNIWLNGGDHIKMNYDFREIRLTELDIKLRRLKMQASNSGRATFKLLLT